MLPMLSDDFALIFHSYTDSLLPKPSVVYTSQHSALIEWPDINSKSDHYIVEYGKDFEHSRTFQISKKTNTAMIHGLNPDTSYRVRVKAPNVDPGPSLRFRTKPYAVSFAAPVVDVKPRPYNQLLVTWNLPPGMRPSDVVHFSLIYSPLYSPFFMKTSLVLPGHYRKFELKFLRPGTVYKVKLAALLKTRKGPYSTWVMEKTESIGVTGPVPKTTVTLKTTPSTLGRTTTMASKVSNQRTHQSIHQTTEQVTTRQQVIKSQATDQTTTYDSPQPTQQSLPQTSEQSTTSKSTKVSTSRQTSKQTFKKTTSPIHQTTLHHTDKTSSQTADQISSQTTERFTTSQPVHYTTSQITHQTRPKTINDTQLKTTHQATPQTPPTSAPSTYQTAPTQTIKEISTTFQDTHPSEGTSPSTQSKRPSTAIPKEAAPPKSAKPTYQLITDTKEKESTMSPTTVLMETPRPTMAEPEGRCERIIPDSICSDNGYQNTKVIFKKDQRQMIKHVENVWSVMASVCKDRVNLKRFLCAVNFPYCSVLIDLPILPCRSMCTITKTSCNLQSNDIWPAELDCDNFPEVGKTMCVSFGRNGDKPELSTTSSILTSVTTPTTEMEIKTKTRKPESSSSLSPISTLATPRTKTSLKNITTAEIPTDGNIISTIGTKKVKTETETEKTEKTTLEPSTLKAAIITENISTEPSTKRPTVKSITDEKTSTDIIPTVNSTGKADFSKEKIITEEQSREDVTTAETMTTDGVHTTASATLATNKSTNENINNGGIDISTASSLKLSSTTSEQTSPPSTAPNPVPSATRTTPLPKSTLGTTPSSLQMSSTGTSTKYYPPPTAVALPPSQTTRSLSRTGVPSAGLRSPLSGRCEKLKLIMCNGVGYKWIQFPNYFNQTHQHDVDRSIYHYWPLVEVQCSKFFTHFLCSFYTPVCTDLLPRNKATIKGNILPCRSLCEKVNRECGPLMQTYKFTWPEAMDCEKLPEDGKETCYYPNSDLVEFAKPTPKPVQSTDVHLGTNGCQEVSVDHVCRKHYLTATLSNMSKSFQTVNTAIKYRIAMFKKNGSRKCLRNLELFMCSLYAPRCSSDYEPLGPCRSQCKTTARRCSFIWKELDTLLPELNNCRQFPLTGCTANRHRMGKLGTKRKSSIETH
ncbi:Frizzled-5 [Exaiptasia diaphana]|nr:Frizzled-5 [Exaiptasia diaphana]